MVFKYEEQEYEIDFEYIQEIFTHKNQVKSGKSKETVCFLIKSIDFKFIGAGHPSRQADGLTKYPVYGWARITYSATIKPLNDDDIETFVVKELEKAKMGINTFDEGALALIVRSAEGNLRLCRNLCLASLIEAARETQKIVTITHVNHVLVQPHWRSHEELIKQQVA